MRSFIPSPYIAIVFISVQKTWKPPNFTPFVCFCCSDVMYRIWCPINGILFWTGVRPGDLCWLCDIENTLSGAWCLFRWQALSELLRGRNKMIETEKNRITGFAELSRNKSLSQNVVFLSHLQSRFSRKKHPKMVFPLDLSGKSSKSFKGEKTRNFIDSKLKKHGEFRPLTADTFLDIWKHYDTDGETWCSRKFLQVSRLAFESLLNYSE